MPQTKRKRVTSPAADKNDKKDQRSDPGVKKVGRTRKKVTASASPSEDQKEEYDRWLMKSEPESRMEKGMDMKFGIEDLKGQPNQTECWDGVRNYQARNFMRAMKIGQEAFFYHSNCKEPGIAGIVKIVKEAYPDHTQFDPKNPHYDSSSKKDNPKWSMVDVQFVRMLKRYIPLAELKSLHQKHKSTGGPLRNMALFTRARLSVQPLTQAQRAKEIARRVLPSGTCRRAQIADAGGPNVSESSTDWEEYDYILGLEEEDTEQDNQDED